MSVARPLPILLLFVTATLVAGPARAQFPFPELQEPPEVRFASSDTLIDHIQTFQQVSQKKLEERGAKLKELRTAIEARISQYRREVERGDGATVELDLPSAERLVAAYVEEQEILASTVDHVKAALAVAQGQPQLPEGRVSLDSVVNRALMAARLVREADSAGAVADRLRALAELETTPVAPDAPLSERLGVQEWQLQVAQADQARARALEIQARARLATRTTQAHRRSLEVKPSDVSVAAENLETVEREVAAERITLESSRAQLRKWLSHNRLPEEKDPEIGESLREAERGLILARFDLLARREEMLDARAARARARHLAHLALSEGPSVDVPAALSKARLGASLAKVEQHRTAAEASIARLREQEQTVQPKAPLRKLASQEREALDENLRVLLETSQHLENVRAYLEIGFEHPESENQTRTTLLNVSLTLGVVLLAGLLLVYGLRWLQALTQKTRGGWPQVRLDDTGQARLDTAILLLWPAVVLGAAAVVIVWPVWNLHLGMTQALTAFEYPIFFIDDTAVTVLSLIQLSFAVWAAVVISRQLRRLMNTRVYTAFGWDSGLSNAFNTFLHYVIIILGFIVGLRFVGISFSSLALFAGVLGIGIGFGLRNITENFISGLIILAERPIKIGDFIDMDGKVEGQVRNIRARATTLVTRDNISIIIPNSEFVGKQVTNWSHGDPKVRIGVRVGVAYGSDTDTTRRVLLEVAARHGQVLKKPAPEVQFEEFGSSSLNFLLLVWIEEQQYRFRIASDLHFAVDAAFRKAKVEIAFPQLDLHLKSISDPVREALRGDAAPRVTGSTASPGGPSGSE